MPAGRLEQRTVRAIPQRRAEFVGEVRQQRDRALLAALGMGDQEHLLVEIHVGNLQVDKLGHPRPVLEQGFDEEAPHSWHA